MLMPAIEHYLELRRDLELRRALGYKLETTEFLLRNFARFASARGDTHVVSHTAMEWAAQTTTARQSHRRLTAIIGLARFLRAEDAHHQIPPRPLCRPEQPRPLPYIFTAEEIRLLMQAARRLGPAGSFRPHTYSTLFSLLAVSGLRVSEALTLRLNDLTNDGLVVRETKFHKSRLVPLHESSAAALTRYLERRQCVASNDDHLFLSLHRTKLCYATVYRLFRQLCAEAGLLHQPGAHRLRLHDLRHTVAVRALETCPHARERVTPHMLALSTYLGHASVRGTFWYLHSTPQLMQDVASAGEAWMAGDDR